MALHGFAEYIATAIELIGVLIIAGGIVYGVYSFLRGARIDGDPSAYAYFRRELGRSIILGLEFLVAADIVYTVATPLSFESLGVLAVLILIRTFLSIEIEMELDGQWPWKRGKSRSQHVSGE